MSCQLITTPPTVNAWPGSQLALPVRTFVDPCVANRNPSMMKETPTAVISGASRGAVRSLR